jgi:photosystem II stability/assembly factor-like uncharacterized protein
MLNLNMPHLLLAALLLIASTLSAQSTSSPWEMENSGTTAGLRGVHAVGGGVVWASGTNGTVLRTEDSGYMWQSCAMPPGAEKLDFRAIWAWDANTAIVMSSGTGDLSKIYKTTDGCSHWKLLYTNPEPKGFYDGLVFLDRERGFVIGDAATSSMPVEGGYYALRIRVTHDEGATWVPVVDAASPPTPGTALYALPDEGFFAASNSSATVGDGYLWLATNQSRVLRIAMQNVSFQAGFCAGAIDPDSRSCGIPWQPWAISAVPLAKGQTAGAFSVALGDGTHGVAVGGDYRKPDDRSGTAAATADGGAHWTASTIPPGGFRSAVAWDADHKFWITVGPNGSDLSRDDGQTWQPIEHAPPDIDKGGEWNALSLPWVVGPNGRIAKLNYERLQPAGKRLKPPSGARPRHPLGQ